MRQIVVKNEREVIENLASEISKCAEAALSRSGIFRVGLSGGSVLNYLCTAIPLIQTDITKWKFFFCDERFVEESDPESTFGVYKRKLIPKIGLHESQFIKINTQVDLEECAVEYERLIMKEFEIKKDQIPQFDLLLLGMGPDGHTCSLFPGHELLNEQKRLIAPISDSPKPPPQRITMTLPLINNARKCIFAICGDGKADIVKRVFVYKESLPAGMIAPLQGELVCIFDDGAGKYLKN